VFKYRAYIHYPAEFVGIAPLIAPRKGKEFGFAPVATRQERNGSATQQDGH
jgi:hypothetical protein